MTTHDYPQAREDGLLVTMVADETVVYDKATHKALCLNALVTAVWEACDGESSSAVILRRIRQAGFVDAKEAVVELAIEDLQEAGLLVGPATAVDERHDPNRREVLRRLAVGAAVLPIISSILISPPVAAISCLAKNQPCSPTIPCCNSCNVHSGKCR